VASAFVRPESYTLDIDRLLLGREASLRTASIGVLHIVIHGAENLPKTDTMGRSVSTYVSSCSIDTWQVRLILMLQSPCPSSIDPVSEPR
jgi:Ca2+-dependent lipid-binding protein